MKTAGKLFLKAQTRRFLLSFCFCVFMLLLSITSFFSAEKANAADETARVEMARLLEEAPSLSSYTGKGAVVLSRHLKNRLLADGSMERSTRWILLYNGRLPSKWGSWTIPAPEGGSVAIGRAELYAVAGVKLLRTLEVTESDEGGTKNASVKIPEASDESLLYIETVQKFPRRFNLDDQVWIALDLPQWELQVEVEVPRGAKLYWAGSGIGQPEKTEKLGTDRYAWHAKNTPAWQGLSILDSGRSSLGFSLRTGLSPSLENLRELESMPVPIPQRLASILTDRDPERSGYRLLQALNEEKSGNESLPVNWVRPVAAPAFGEGPWTDWEATLIAVTGLKSLGWTAIVWWLPSITVAKDAPAGNSLWACPVIEATPPGGKAFLFKRGSASNPGKIPSVLIGTTLYRLEGGKVLAMKNPEGSASSNRLAARWELDLDEAGVATGKVMITLKGGWDYLLRSGATTSRERATELAREMLFSTPFLSGMGTPELSDSGSGLRIIVPVKGLLGISGQKDLLVKFPATDLPGIREILEAGGKSTLRFPISIQQEFLVRLPAGYRVLEPPSMRERNMGKAMVEESFRNREKKGLVEASQLVSITVSRLDENGLNALNESLALALRWGANSIPLRKR